MKREMRLAGVEDGSFKAFPKMGKERAFLCCVEMIGHSIVEVSLSRIEVDGIDATDKILSMLGTSKVEAVILGGITFAGFNIIDPFIIHQVKNIPIIIYSPDKPNNEAMLAALKSHFDDWESRWKIIRNIGKVREMFMRKGTQHIYFEVVGCSSTWAEEILKISTFIGRVPEPVRVARMISRGIS